jgi:hypothetical protein
MKSFDVPDPARFAVYGLVLVVSVLCLVAAARRARRAAQAEEPVQEPVAV